MSEEKAREACHVLGHPILHHNLTQLRDEQTSPVDFRRVMEQLSALMAYEITRDISVTSKDVKTPLADTEGTVVNDDMVIVVKRCQSLERHVILAVRVSSIVLRLHCEHCFGVLHVLPLKTKALSSCVRPVHIGFVGPSL